MNFPSSDQLPVNFLSISGQPPINFRSPFSILWVNFRTCSKLSRWNAVTILSGYWDVSTLIYPNINNSKWSSKFKHGRSPIWAQPKYVLICFTYLQSFRTIEWKLNEKIPFKRHFFLIYKTKVLKMAMTVKAPKIAKSPSRAQAICGAS